ncbi:polymer-forming cytoskeletal protein [Idiomarina sp.]|uniref:polymer-forming cytoskeletal protein n=1 Tax=Idiomarina sp. TaxID=1874361 RepID=UPI0025C563D2|nr:polymer-forming cytoskeletal protein [Idiomarina sp.]
MRWLLIAISLTLFQYPVLAAKQDILYLPDAAENGGTGPFQGCTLDTEVINSVSTSVVTCDFTVDLDINKLTVELSQTPVVLRITGVGSDLELGGADINATGNQSDLTIEIDGDLVLDGSGNSNNIINANLIIDGSITAGNNTAVNGGLTVGGNVTIGNNSTIEGNIDVEGDLSVGNNGTIVGDVSANDITFNGNQTTVTGNVYAEGDLVNEGTITGNVNVNGNLDNSGTIEGGYVNAPCTETNSCGGGTIDVDLTCNTDNIDENTSACEPGGGGTEIHSFLLSHSGTALTCESFPVTVTACADAGCTPIALDSASADVNLGNQTATASFTSTATTTVNFDLTTPGTYTLSLSNLVDVTTTNNTQFSPSSQVTAVDTALRFSGEQTQLSGSDFTLGLEAIRTDTNTGACVAAFNTNKSVNFSLTCEDPTLCSEPIAIEGTSVNSTTAVDVTFVNGSSSIAVNYPDVGRIRLNANAQGDTGNTLAGTSQAFVVKPYGIGFGISGGIDPNTAGSAGTYAEDTVFEKAGEPFTVTLAAINQDGSSAPSFGAESTAEGLEVKSHNLLAPANDGSNTANTGNIDVVGNQVTFSEVGVINLEAGLLDNDYLGAGTIPNRTSQPIGRFIPDQFVQTNGELFGACDTGTFYYMGQQQTFTVQLMAVNSDGTWTQNYYGGFANGLPEFYSFSTSDTGTAQQLGRLADFSGYLDWQNGMSEWLDSPGGSATEPVITITRQADGSPDGHYPEYTLAWQIDDGERDNSNNARYLTKIENSVFAGVAGSAAIDSIGLYYGRMVLENTFGSEAEQLPVFARTEYYFDNDPEDSQPGRFVVNEQDTCTTLVSQQLSDAVSSTDLPAVRVPAANDVEQTVSAGQLFDANELLTEQLGWTQPDELSGTFEFELLLDLTANELLYLQYDWNEDGSYDDNPTASGTFGIYRGSDRQIYWQEVFQ